MIKKALFVFGLLAVAITAGLLLQHTLPAQASVNFNDLMDDAIFENTGTMSAGQIDSFLNSFPNSCISSSNGFSTPDPTGWSASEPNNHGYTFGGNVTAGQAIFDASRIYHINPQVLLATMQKEQTIVTGSGSPSSYCHYTNQSPGNACNQSIYNTVGGCVFIGMSYACPGGCDASYSGFSLQLIAGAWLFRFAEERSQGITSGYSGYDPGDSSIGYGGPQVGVPDTLQDGNTVIPQTGATAALYYYTPFESSSFDNIFMSWFGSVDADFTVAVADSGNTTTQYLLYGSIKQAIPSIAVKVDWGLGNYQPVTMNAAILAAIPNGPTLDRLYRINGGPAVYFVDGGTSYWVSSPQMMAAWNNFDGAAIASVPSDLAGITNNGGALTYNILSTGSNIQYMVDGGDGSSANSNNGNIVLRQYPNTNVLQAFEGDNVGVTTITDSSYFSQMTVGTALTADGFTIKTASDTTQYQVVAGQKMYLSGAIAALYNQTAETVSQATINRLVTTSPASQFIRLPGNGVTIYMVDNGQIHAIPSINVLQAWLPSTSTAVNILDNGFFNLMTAGSAVNSYEADVSGQLYVMNGNAVMVPSDLDSTYRIATPFSADAPLIALYNSQTATAFVKSPTDPSVYLIDATTKRHIINPTVYTLWNGSRNEGLTMLSSDVLNQFSNGTDITSNYVNNGSGNFALDNGSYYSVAGSVATAWGFSAPVSVSAAILNHFTNTGQALTNTIRSGSSYYLIKYGLSHATINTNIANIWGINTSGPNFSQTFVNLVPPSSSLGLFVQSTDPSDLRIFVADSGGNLYTLNSIQQLLNYGYVSGSLLQLTPGDINAMTITNAQNILKNGSNYAVLDGGSKRAFNTGQDQTNWLTSSNYTTVSNYLWAYIPSGSSIGSTIKGSAPNVYAVSNGQKQWIQSGQTYLSSYAPYQPVSDYLIYLLPNGANIP
jgi:hypothetical protein